MELIRLRDSYYSFGQHSCLKKISQRSAGRNSALRGALALGQIDCQIDYSGRQTSWSRKLNLKRQGPANVRFGSQADICVAKDDVRFTPNSDRESRHLPKVMSALPLKADMCAALAHVCFGPKADIASPIRSPRQPVRLAFGDVDAERLGGSCRVRLW